MIRLFVLLTTLTLLCGEIFAEEPPAVSWVAGEGSKFSIAMGPVSGEVAIYVTRVDGPLTSVEMHFAYTSGPASILAASRPEMWMQTEYEKPKVEGRPVRIVNGYLLSAGMNAPEHFNPMSVAESDGLGLVQFLHGSRASLDEGLVGEEKVTTEAGTVSALHYRKVKGDQTLDFWISEAAKPLGLVRLVSRGGKSEFQMELKSLVKNVAPKIDPRKARPASPQTLQLVNISAMSGLLP